MKYKRKDLIVFCAECGYEMDDPETHKCPLVVHIQYTKDRPGAEKRLAAALRAKGKG